MHNGLPPQRREHPFESRRPESFPGRVREIVQVHGEVVSAARDSLPCLDSGRLDNAQENNFPAILFRQGHGEIECLARFAGKIQRHENPPQSERAPFGVSSSAISAVGRSWRFFSRFGFHSQFLKLKAGAAEKFRSAQR